MKQQDLNTRLVHAGERSRDQNGAIVTPVYQTAMYEYAASELYDDVRYIRMGNSPNHAAVEAKLANIEEGEAALVAASGMAASVAAVLNSLGTGGHVLAQRSLYGGTHTFMTEDLQKMGHDCTLIDPAHPETWDARMRPNTRVLYCETISNPLMEVGDLKALVAFARAHGLVSIIDNTFASPVNFRPIPFGFDISMHSCTKYLNGHSDLVAGALIGSKEKIASMRKTLVHLGGSIDPHTCYLLQRGMKTLALRVHRQTETAGALAEFLSSHSKVKRVLYPGLPSSQGHAWANEALYGYGGMLGFELEGDVSEAEAFLNRMTIPVIAPSLGGVETLLTRPAATSHLGVPPDARAAVGITDTLIRCSVGIEGRDDLLTDFKRALDGAEENA
ncbi:MAG: PLP-dependent transferase [Gemmatimonadetes bacterium]|nr:PLP-dependent transferase [Gemmatimonadota bacterium]